MAGFFVSFGIGEGSISFGELLFEFLGEVLLAVYGLEAVLLDFLEVEIVDDEAGGHDVVLVDVFNKWLDGGLLDELLFVDAPLDSLGVSGDADQQQMREPILLISFLVVLDDDGLLACESARGDDHDSPCFETMLDILGTF